MELLVYFNGPQLFSFDESTISGFCLRQQIALSANIDPTFLFVIVDGTPLNDSAILLGENIGAVRCALRIQGGKGGYGAMLRSMAKQSGKKKTTDFGACRDLSGRRLRHVNDEIILQKWREAKENGQDFDVNQITRTGIDMWFLPAPSWTEGFHKPSHRKVYMKDRRKTQLCIDWERARNEGVPPKGAPVWWGCPRGPRCEFAHGESELPAATRKQLEEERRSERGIAAQAQRQKYLSSADSDSLYEESGGILAVVTAGLQASSKSSPWTEQSIEESDSGKLEAKYADREVDDSCAWLIALGSYPANSAPSVDMNGTIVGRGEDLLSSIRVADCCLTDGSWYFEVELFSEGLVQVNFN
jgi:hypothetical protein